MVMGMLKVLLQFPMKSYGELLREFSRSNNEGFVVKAHPHVADRLLEEDKIFLDELKGTA